jgi:hypothetical protein
MDIDWTLLIAKILIAIIMVIIIPNAIKLYKLIDAKLTQSKMADFWIEVKKTVAAVEQMYKVGQIDIDFRLTEATNVLQKWLDKNRLPIDADALRHYIEAEVSLLPPTHEAV